MLVPAIAHYRKMRIEWRSQASEQVGQRILEVAVLALAESVPSHVDVTAEEFFLRIQRGNFPALVAGKQFIDRRATETVQIGTCPAPIVLFQSDFSGRHCSGVRTDDAVLFMRSLLLSNGPRLDRLSWRAIRPLLGYRGWRAFSDDPPHRVLAEAIDLARREPQLAFAVCQSLYVRETFLDQVGDTPQRICLGANLLLRPRDGWNLAAFRVACRDSSSASHIWTCFQARRPAGASRRHHSAVLQSHTPIFAFKLSAHRET